MLLTVFKVSSNFVYNFLNYLSSLCTRFGVNEFSPVEEKSKGVEESSFLINMQLVVAYC